MREMPFVLRCAFIGTVAMGLVGAVAGLISGLIAYPPTAWFAVFEAGIPAGIVGGILGFVVGLLAAACRGAHRRWSRARC
jgi:ABC-type uncharacterized transport system permease subunit